MNSKVWIAGAVMVMLSGCATTQYRRGLKAGARDYALMKESKMPKSVYAYGWVSGWSAAKTLDDVEKSLNALKKSLEELNKRPTPASDSEMDKWINELLDNPR